MRAGHAFVLALAAGGALAGSSSDSTLPVAGPSQPRTHGPIHLPITHHRPTNIDTSTPAHHRAIHDRALLLRAKYARHMDPKTRRRLQRDLDTRMTQERLSTWQRDTIYTTTLEIGTPPQLLEVQLDTGSADTYIYSECTSAACSKAKQYDRHASTTFQPLSKAKEHIEYGKGYADGYWVEDTVSVAGEAIASQRFLATDDSYTGTNVSGLAGLAWSSLASGDATPFWLNLVDKWVDKRFGFYLERAPSTPAAEAEGASSPGGTITFNGVDTSRFTGDIHYAPLSSQDYWRVWMDHFRINGAEVATGEKYSAIIDTGATLLSGPAELVEQLYARVPGAVKSTRPNEQGFYHVPCDADISLSLEIGGKYFAIAPRDMVYTATKEDKGMCIGSLIAAEIGSVHWVIGDVFLKNVYSVFRFDPPAVGFAALREPAPVRPGLPEVVSVRD